MYRIPITLDLSPAIGESIACIEVGLCHLQFTIGPIHFAVESPVTLYQGGKQIAYWECGKWPEAGFYRIMDTDVVRCDVVTEILIVFEFKNGIEMHLEDSSDQYESMRILFEEDINSLTI